MTDQWMHRLSEYLDGDLDATERAGLEAHFAGCEACRTTLAELRRVAQRAQALIDRPPARDLWPEIAERIGVSSDQLAARRARRRVSFTVPQLIAAGVALIAVSAGIARWSLRPGGPGPSTASAVGALRPVAWTVKADSSADRAVDDLRAALLEGQRTGRLSPVTVQKLEHSLAVIDSAIAEAKRALALDPQSAYLNHHLADTMRHKLEFLREANRIATART